MPVFHIGGTGWGMVGLYQRRQGRDRARVRSDEVLDFIEQYRITKMFMVPAALQFVVRSRARARSIFRA